MTTTCRLPFWKQAERPVPTLAAFSMQKLAMSREVKIRVVERKRRIRQ
jgi:predicted PP-loop superfamily ATPase